MRKLRKEKKKKKEKNNQIKSNVVALFCKFYYVIKLV